MNVRARLHLLQPWLQNLGNYFTDKYRVWRRLQQGRDEYQHTQDRKAAEELLRFATKRLNADDAIDEAVAEQANGHDGQLSRALNTLLVLRPNGAAREPVIRLAGTEVCLLLSQRRAEMLRGQRVTQSGSDSRSGLGVISERGRFLRVFLGRQHRQYVVTPVHDRLDLLETGHLSYTFDAMLTDLASMVQVTV